MLFLRLLALGALLSCASTSSEPAEPAPQPGALDLGTAVVVGQRAVFGFLAAELSRAGTAETWYVENTEGCRRLLRPGRTVAASALFLPVLEAAGERCPTVGLQLPLSRPTTDGEATTARGQAEFVIVDADAQHALLRGRFPLAHAWLGEARAQHAISAIVRREPACEVPLQRGIAPIEVSPREPGHLMLVSELGLCPILGLLP